MLVFQCHACGQKIKVENALAGKGIRCPKCHVVVRVPHEPPHLGAPSEHLAPEEQHVAGEGATAPPGPKLGDPSERHVYRPAAPMTYDDELTFQPLAPPPLRKPSSPAAEPQPQPGATSGITPPADDDPDEFKLQPLAPPPMRKPPAPPPRPEAIAAEPIVDEPPTPTEKDDLSLKSVSPPPLKKSPPPLPGKSP